VYYLHLTGQIELGLLISLSIEVSRLVWTMFQSKHTKSLFTWPI